MRILVTGGAGYIGSHACKALQQQGLTPVVFDNLSTGQQSAVQFGPFVQGDILNTDTVVAALKKYAIDAVMHFAASASVACSAAHPADYYRNNVEGTLHLLEAMRRCQVSKLVFSSTCAIFGPPTCERLDETHPQNPINTYGASKSICERIMRDYAQAYGLRSIALRYFNAAGADAEGQLGECHEPETHLIPLALQAAQDGAKLQVFGDDYATADGTCVRDYVHVEDLAQAHLLALNRLDAASDLGFEAFNLGNSRGFSVREIVRCVQHVTRRRLQVEVGPRRPGDSATLVADARVAHQVLSWRPRYPHIEPIVASAWRWMQSKNSEDRLYPKRVRSQAQPALPASI